MSNQKFLIQFELTFRGTYSRKQIKEYAQEKLKPFYTINNLKVSKIK